MIDLTNGFVGLWYIKTDDVIPVYHFLNNGPLTITQMTDFNTIRLFHLLVDDNYKLVYCGDALYVIIKENNI